MLPTLNVFARLTAVAASAWLAVTCSPTTARACTCPRPGLQTPAPGARDVPVNTRIWVLDGLTLPANDPGALTLVGPQGPVAVEIGRLAALAPAYAVYVLTPRAPLQAATAYQVVTRDRPDPVTTFVTASTPDHRSPTLPVERARRASAGVLVDSDCGRTWQTVEAEIAVDADVLAVHLTLDDVAPPPPGLTSSAPAPGPPYFMVQPKPLASVTLGKSACAVWPQDLVSGWLWYGAFDKTGGFSGWTAAGRVDLPALPGDSGTTAANDAGTEASVDAAPNLPAPRGGGCAFATGPAPGPSMLLVGLCAPLLRRRRRASSDRRGLHGGGCPPTPTSISCSPPELASSA